MTSRTERLRPERHIPFQWLADLGDERLRGRRLDTALGHLATGCGRCARDLAMVKNLVCALTAGPLDGPPRSQVRRAKSLFKAAWLPVVDMQFAVTGILVTDQRTHFAAALRDSPGATRRLLWTLGDGLATEGASTVWEIDASLTPRGTHTDLLAQVLPASGDPDRSVEGRVRARSGARKAVTARLLPDGRFTFRALRPGSYVLEGEVEGLRFRLPPLVID